MAPRWCVALAVAPLVLGTRSAGWAAPGAPVEEAARGGASEPGAAPDDVDEAEPPRTTVRVFGDIDWRSRRDDEPSTFTLGQLDVFVTSALAPNLSALAEVVLETPSEGDDPIAEVERFQVQYSPVDAFRVSVGRMHSMLGFWNQAYHHGAWLQTTAFRPEVYRWEDEGGLLPVHEAGLRLSGTAATAPVRFEYAVSLANGRAPRLARVAAVQDDNGAKAVHLWAGITPQAIPQMQLGGAAVFDRIGPDPGTPGRESSLDERIWGAFVAYQGRRFELMAEGFAIRHRDDQRSLEWRTSGLYAQAAWAAGRFKPYYRFDRIAAGEGDPYYGSAAEDVTKHTAGLRVDPWSRLTLKLEFSRSEIGGAAPFGSAAAQAAFTF